MPKEIESSEQQRAPEPKPQSFWEQYGAVPLASIMRNPRVTPVVLLILAAAPFAVLAVVLALFLFSPE